MNDVSYEARIGQLGLELPAAPAAVGSYIPVIQFGNVVVTSGQLPFVGKEITFQGKLGENLTEEQMIKDGLSAPLHAGAAKYYKERGWM